MNKRLLAAITLLSFALCLRTHSTEVVVYVAMDQIFAEAVLEEFQQKSGIKVRAVYDVEASKTTGLTTRLIAERDHPRADLFWSGEFLQTLALAKQGILGTGPDPENATGLPAEYRDSQGAWYGAGGRARVLLVNTRHMKPEDFPRSLRSLVDPRIPAGKAGMALPLFGTSATHAAALRAAWGAEKATGFYREIKSRGVRIVDGNSVVRDLVASGELWFGITDTDDALGAVEKHAPVQIIAPDQSGNEEGTLVVFGTVARIRGGKNPDQATALIDYILSAETERTLIEAGAYQWSIRNGKQGGKLFPNGLRPLHVDRNALLEAFPDSAREMREIFVR